jgi:hypothetical protein
MDEWTKDDMFQLVMPDRKDLNPLLVAIGVEPLQIIAKRDAGGRYVQRKNHIQGVISHQTKLKSGDVVLELHITDNDTGMRLESNTLRIELDDWHDDEFCQIKKIHGLIF